MSDQITEQLTERLRASADMKEKADIAGLAHTPVEGADFEMSCENCIYFLARRSWCDLPELNIPVDPEWYCYLWRV